MRATRLLKRLCASRFKINTCCLTYTSNIQVRHGATVVGSNFNIFVPAALIIRNLGLGPTSKDFEEPLQIGGPITKAHATELVLHLNDEERKMLFNALQEYESNRIKEEFEGMLINLLNVITMNVERT